MTEQRNIRREKHLERAKKHGPKAREKRRLKKLELRKNMFLNINNSGKL